MLQARLIFYFLLVAIVAVSAISVKPAKEQQVQQSLLDVDDVNQGHANVGERLARQYKRRGGYPYRNNKRRHGGYYG